MDTKTQQQLKEKYPDFLQDMGGDPRKSCMAFGICIDDGWTALFCKLCQDIKALNPEGFVFSQVKEKFAGLRVYWRSKTHVTEIGKLVDAAEKESYKTCEYCGSTKDVTVAGRTWLKALCPSCHKEREAEHKRRTETKPASSIG